MIRLAEWKDDLNGLVGKRVWTEEGKCGTIIGFDAKRTLLSVRIMGGNELINCLSPSFCTIISEDEFVRREINSLMDQLTGEGLIKVKEFILNVD